MTAQRKVRQAAKTLKLVVSALKLLTHKQQREAHKQAGLEDPRDQALAIQNLETCGTVTSPVPHGPETKIDNKVMHHAIQLLSTDTHYTGETLVLRLAEDGVLDSTASSTRLLAHLHQYCHEHGLTSLTTATGTILTLTPEDKQD
jgi:hypothetical protein